MDIRELNINGFYRVIVGEDYSFRAIIVLHTENAHGGCRRMEYTSLNDQLEDTYRLAQGMTDKCAAAGIAAGGGKSTILAGLDMSIEDTYKKFAYLLNYVNKTDKYMTGGDIGTGDTELAILGTHTKHLLASASIEDTGWGTAYGVYVAMTAAAKYRGITGRLRVNISGLGKVGSRLAQICSEAGHSVIISDKDYDRARNTLLSIRGNAILAAPDTAHELECEVYAPCSIGGIINETTIPQLSTKIICGGANNQLCSDDMKELLADRDITYVPDYVANAGGLITAYNRLQLNDNNASYKHPTILEHLNTIADTTLRHIDKQPTSYSQQ